MNRPRHKHVIVLDDNVFEIGDIVEVKTESRMAVIKGRIHDIDSGGFIVDTSSQYHHSCCEVRYRDVIDIKTASA